MSKFLKETIKNAKSQDEAKALALAELGVSEDEAVIEVLEEGAKGFLGIGSKDAKIKATVKDVPTLAAKTFLKDVFGAMQLDVQVKTDRQDNDLKIELSGENMGIIIGKRGDTLDAVQYLTSLIANHESEEYIKVSVDTENYREKRTESLIALSERIAEKVNRTGKKFTLEPMNPYERRVIHANLQDNADITTYSVGSEPYRKVVIAPKNSKPYYKKPYAKSGYNSAARPERKKMYKNIDEMLASENNEE